MQDETAKKLTLFMYQSDSREGEKQKYQPKNWHKT